MEDSTKAQQENLETLRVQSENTLAIAKISALSVRISVCSQRLTEAANLHPQVRRVLGDTDNLSEIRERLTAELHAELQKLKEKQQSA
jgi:hypothetical protein